MKRSKIYDITKFCSQSEIKPEINKVYVQHDGDTLVYVATDTYRLVEIRQEGDLFTIIPPGFYSQEQWKFIVKTFNKNPKELQTLQPLDVNYFYPTYQNIIPKETEDVSITINNMDPKLFSEVVEFTSKAKNISPIKVLEKIKQSGKMIIYKDELLTWLCMSLSK